MAERKEHTTLNVNLLYHNSCPLPSRPKLINKLELLKTIIFYYFSRPTSIIRGSHTSTSSRPDTWLLKFNASKCKVMQIGRKRNVNYHLRSGMDIVNLTETDMEKEL